jgi:hypothetical protein
MNGNMDWNERYSKESSNWAGPPRALLRNNLHMLHGGQAFVAAMGMGNDFPLLIEKGYQVYGVDRSEVAVKHVHREYPKARVVLADLGICRLPVEKFDLICNFYYLERNLWAQYERSLVEGGVLLIETLTLEMLSLKPDINPEKLLRPGELRELFPALELVEYREGWIDSDHGGRKAVASLVARKKNDQPDVLNRYAFKE